MARKGVIKLPVSIVPKDLGELSDWLLQIAEEQRYVDIINLELNKAVDELKKNATDDVRIHQEKITQNVDGIYSYAQSHRDELTKGGERKTVELPGGILKWRFTPSKVTLVKVKLVLENLKKLGLERFIRVKEEVNKEDLSKEIELAKTIQGISITQSEEFVIIPAKLDVEIVKEIGKIRQFS